MILKFGFEVTQRSLKLVPFESFGAVSDSPSIVTEAVSVVVCEIFSVKEWCDLENKVSLGFIQGHWKWHHLIDRIRVPICLPSVAGWDDGVSASCTVGPIVR